MKLLNGEILGAVQSLGELRKLKLPIKTSSDLVKMALKLEEPLKAYQEVLKGLFETNETITKQDGDAVLFRSTKKEHEKWDYSKATPPNVEKCMAGINELLRLESEVVIQKVKLPEKIAGTCDKCSHNMDVPLQIEGELLLPLEKLIEVG